MGEGTSWRRLVILALLATASPSIASAQTPSDLRLRFGLSGGLVASGDQQAIFDLDLPVVAAEVRAGWVAHEVVVLEARLGGAAFFSSPSSPGGLIDLSLGAEAGGTVDVARLWGSVHVGAGVTGTLVRPVLYLALGIDVAVSPELGIGPILEYGHLFEEDGPGFSDDAAWVTVGVSMTYRPPGSPPPAEPPRPSPPVTRAPRTPPPPAPPPLEPEVLMDLLDEAAGLEPRELLVPVLFHFDSTELVACSVASLRSLGDHLDQHPEIELLEIEAHADGSGSDAYNRDLSERRAGAIRDWLVEHGVAAERLRVAARGESTPVETNADEPGREQNRRARFRVVLER